MKARRRRKKFAKVPFPTASDRNQARIASDKSPLDARHSRESGNPQTNAKAGASSPSEIKYKCQPADPLSLDGLTGVGFGIRLSPRHSRESGNPVGCRQVRHPKSGINANRRIPSPFDGLTRVVFEFRRFSGCWNLGGRGEQRTGSAIRNQVQIAVIGSLLPLWEKARMRVRRAQARLCRRDFGANLPL